MKRTDLVTEMRMNKMSLLLNILEKEEFGYLQHIYCQKNVSNYVKQSNCQNNRITKTILLNTGKKKKHEQINEKKKKKRAKKKKKKEEKKEKKKLNWLSHCL